MMDIDGLKQWMKRGTGSKHEYAFQLDKSLDEITRLRAENERLRAMVDQMHGMAIQGWEAPNAAFRWCERIDEVAHFGAMPDYEQFARAALHHPRQDAEE